MKNRIEEMRNRKGVRQEELARAMDVSRQTISSLENGRYNRFWIDECGYPDIGIAFGEAESGGHEMYFPDYRLCGKNGEPAVMNVSSELDYTIVKIADSFEEFLGMLHE